MAQLERRGPDEDAHVAAFEAESLSCGPVPERVLISTMGNTLVFLEGAEGLEWGVPVEGGMGALGVVEGDPAFDGERSGPGFAKGPGVEAFLVQGAMGAFDLAGLLGGPHGDELVADAAAIEGLLDRSGP